MPGPQHDPSAPTGDDGSAADPGTNWAGNHVYTAARYVRARSPPGACSVSPTRKA